MDELSRVGQQALKAQPVSAPVGARLIPLTQVHLSAKGVSIWPTK